MTIAELVPLYLAHVAEKSESTASTYGRRLKGLVAELGGRELGSLRPLDLDALWRKTDRFPAGHAKAGELKAPDTRRLDRVVFGLLQKWAISRKELAAPVVDKLELPTGRTRERIPTAAETKAILDAAHPSFRLAYQALRQSGARPNELARATFADLKRDDAGGAVAIELKKHKTANKTGKPRTIAIGERLGELLEVATAGRSSGPLFLDRKGRPWTTRKLGRTFRDLRDRLGLPKDLVLYLSRHEHLTAVCNRFGIHAAAEAAGHTDIKTTRRYVKSNLDLLRRNQDAFGDEAPPRAA